MKHPKNLQKGDTVACISTARAFSKEDLGPFLEVLESWGLKVKLGRTIGLVHHQFAGTKLERQTDLQEMLDNPEIKAIFCVKGGYGTVQLLDNLDLDQFKQNPKWIIGFSDVTALLNHVYAQTNISSGIHSWMACTMLNTKTNTIDRLHQQLFTGSFLPLTCNPNPENKIGAGTGPLIGGNLSVMISLLGSNSIPSVKGKILFLEDLDEYLYHIDRMMMALKRAGILSSLAGLMVGGMTKMNDNAIPFGQEANEIIGQAVKDYTYPVCFDFPVGHIAENTPLVIGCNYELQVSGNEVSLKDTNIFEN